MKIGIIGGGALGLLFSAYLSDFHDVTLYVRTREQEELITEEGILLIKGGKTFKKRVRVRISENVSREEELLIVAVKQYSLKTLFEKIHLPETPLLFIQNGYSHVPMLEKLQTKNIFLGVVEHGALKHKGNIVEHTGEGKTKVAAYKGECGGMPLLGFKIENFPFIWSEDYRQMLLEKLVVNAVINPLTGILGIRNGVLLENPHYFTLFTNYCKEISSILDLERETTQKHVEQVCRKTSSNRSSLLKDLESGKKTEIEAILGYVIQVAKEKGKNHELAQAVYWMVKGKECQGEDHS
ncbi:2-dehydropantoate 2-reductase [Peribacillus glennii]|uniref:2-dehydropantoate 2-reductase n=1 Tax=Peribacillus glennii TaxID=2303991 RepID=A0A372LC05_9BACI|nr:2-dehydropantoate 2-reductase [Peribacillus glennii]RFU63379.1 2-dehydropantoate 2-reductase [Peribacillus glennii]